MGGSWTPPRRSRGRPREGRSAAAGARPPFILPEGTLLWGWFVAAPVIADPSLRLLTYGSVAAITKESRLLGARAAWALTALAVPGNFECSARCPPLRTCGRVPAFHARAPPAP